MTTTTRPTVPTADLIALAVPLARAAAATFPEPALQTALRLTGEQLQFLVVALPLGHGVAQAQRVAGCALILHALGEHTTGNDAPAGSREAIPSSFVTNFAQWVSSLTNRLIKPEFYSNNAMVAEMELSLRALLARYSA